MKIGKLSTLLIISIGAVCVCSCNSGLRHENKFESWPVCETLDRGMFWPEHQVVPRFADPADTLDAMFVDKEGRDGDELITLATLQGIVNREKPRIFFLKENRGGRSEWVDRIGISIREIPYESRWDLVRKYSSELKGVVLYDASRSIHYRNLASTVAGITGCIAAVDSVYNVLSNHGINLDVVADLRNLQFTDKCDIYNYMYEKYWPQCNKRLLLSHSPSTPCDIRDIAVATGGAIFWLDPRKEEEKAVASRFIADMVPGDGIVLGWWPEERSGIGLVTSYGLSTIPSDFYDNATVFAGGNHVIHHARIPQMPELENKIYIALFLSDGDNVQYCQHTMSRLWDSGNRGLVPINWTASPGLADIGPDILNYYYATATDNDCISSGPSGIGYALIYDAHNKRWFTEGRDRITPYTRLTNQYLEKSGMRVITLWDEVSEEQIDAYAENCRYLYGMTEQDWMMGEKVTTVHSRGRLAVLPNRPCYVGRIDDIVHHWKDTLSAYKADKPVFLTAQGVSWVMGPDEMLNLKETLEAMSPGNIVLCRGDHFFALYNQANGLDFNLALLPSAEVSSSSSGYDCFVADGSSAPEYQWVDSQNGEKWIAFDFGKPYLIDRYVVRHAGYAGAPEAMNTRSFDVEVSLDGENWTLADVQKGNRKAVSDVDFPAVEARFVRFNIRKAASRSYFDSGLYPGTEDIAVIGDIEVYGRELPGR